MSAPTVTPELKVFLRRVKLGRCLDTLPERLALAATGGLGHAEFLELVLPTKSPAAKPAPPTDAPGPPDSTRR